jgi:hypothetical protein
MLLVFAGGLAQTFELATTVSGCQLLAPLLKLTAHGQALKVTRLQQVYKSLAYLVSVT